MAQKCPGCHRSFRSVNSHLRNSSSCPAAQEYQAQAQRGTQGPTTTIIEDDDEIEAPLTQVRTDQIPPEPPNPPTPPGVSEQEKEPQITGLTAEQATAMMTEFAKQINVSVNQRLTAEREAINQQFSQVGPSVLQYLREEAAKEQAETQRPATASPQPPVQPGGGDSLLGQLAGILQIMKPSTGGLDQAVEALGSLGKLADALDSLRYKPWLDGHNFATNSILQQTRMGIEPGEAARGLADNPPNWAKRPPTESEKK